MDITSWMEAFSTFYLREHAGLFLRKSSQTKGNLSWTYPCHKAIALMVESIQNPGISSTSKWIKFGSDDLRLKLKLSLHTRILLFILQTATDWARSGTMLITFISPFEHCSGPATSNSVEELVDWILVHNYGIVVCLVALFRWFHPNSPNKLGGLGRKLSHSCSSRCQVVSALDPQKCLLPASCMVVLGTELDTAAKIACLPELISFLLCRSLPLIG